jgi:hypothetical protein
MTVIDRALERLDEEMRVHDFGAENEKDLAYWAAYLDGARAQKCEDDAEIKKLNGIIDVFVNDGTSVPSAWISVKDRLPDDDENVLAYNSESGDIDMAWYNGYKWFLEDTFECVELHPTHWMPLPDAPEVEG